MKKILKLTAFLLILAGVLSACKKPDDTKIDYPINVPFEVYSLIGTECQWLLNLIDFDTVVMVNNNEELQNFITCTSGNYPEIDFSKHSLLMARGVCTSGIVALEMQLQQISSNGYSLDVDITMDMTAVPQGWFISITVPKLSSNDTVTLNINDHY